MSSSSFEKMAPKVECSLQSSFEMRPKHPGQYIKHGDIDDIDEIDKNDKLYMNKSYCCCFFGVGAILLLLYLFGVIHSTDSSCIQNEDLNFNIASKWKSEYGWVCCANSIAAEPSDWWKTNSDLIEIAQDANTTVKFYDVSCGKLLYEAPVSRTMAEFIKESKEHGWPSFRKDEIVDENVNTREGGEIVSTCGTHLGHNLPDSHGKRHCINLLCIAGSPPI